MFLLLCVKVVCFPYFISLDIQGPKSPSVISNLVLTDRKNPINIKAKVNPVKERWEMYA